MNKLEIPREEEHDNRGRDHHYHAPPFSRLVFALSPLKLGPLQQQFHRQLLPVTRRPYRAAGPATREERQREEALEEERRFACERRLRGILWDQITRTPIDDGDDANNGGDGVDNNNNNSNNNNNTNHTVVLGGMETELITLSDTLEQQRLDIVNAARPPCRHRHRHTASAGSTPEVSTSPLVMKKMEKMTNQDPEKIARTIIRGYSSPTDTVEEEEGCVWGWSGYPDGEKAKGRRNNQEEETSGAEDQKECGRRSLFSCTICTAPDMPTFVRVAGGSGSGAVSAVGSSSNAATSTNLCAGPGGGCGEGSSSSPNNKNYLQAKITAVTPPRHPHGNNTPSTNYSFSSTPPPYPPPLPPPPPTFPLGHAGGALPPSHLSQWCFPQMWVITAAAPTSGGGLSRATTPTTTSSPITTCRNDRNDGEWMPSSSPASAADSGGDVLMRFASNKLDEVLPSWSCLTARLSQDLAYSSSGGMREGGGASATTPASRVDISIYPEGLSEALALERIHLTLKMIKRMKKMKTRGRKMLAAVARERYNALRVYQHFCPTAQIQQVASVPPQTTPLPPPHRKRRGSVGSHQADHENNNNNEDDKDEEGVVVPSPPVLLTIVRRNNKKKDREAGAKAGMVSGSAGGGGKNTTRRGGGEVPSRSKELEEEREWSRVELACAMDAPPCCLMEVRATLRCGAKLLPHQQQQQHTDNTTATNGGGGNSGSSSSRKNEVPPPPLRDTCGVVAAPPTRTEELMSSIRSWRHDGELSPPLLHGLLNDAALHLLCDGPLFRSGGGDPAGNGFSFNSAHPHYNNHGLLCSSVDTDGFRSPGREMSVASCGSLGGSAPLRKMMCITSGLGGGVAMEETERRRRLLFGWNAGSEEESSSSSSSSSSGMLDSSDEDEGEGEERDGVFESLTTDEPVGDDEDMLSARPRIVAGSHQNTDLSVLGLRVELRSDNNNEEEPEPDAPAPRGRARRRKPKRVNMNFAAEKSASGGGGAASNLVLTALVCVAPRDGAAVGSGSCFSSSPEEAERGSATILAVEEQWVAEQTMCSLFPTSFLFCEKLSSLEVRQVYCWDPRSVAEEDEDDDDDDREVKGDRLKRLERRAGVREAFFSSEWSGVGYALSPAPPPPPPSVGNRDAGRGGASSSSAAGRKGKKPNRINDAGGRRSVKPQKNETDGVKDGDGRGHAHPPQLEGNELSAAGQSVTTSRKPSQSPSRLPPPLPPSPFSEAHAERRSTGTEEEERSTTVVSAEKLTSSCARVQRWRVPDKTHCLTQCIHAIRVYLAHHCVTAADYRRQYCDDRIRSAAIEVLTPTSYSNTKAYSGGSGGGSGANSNNYMKNIGKIVLNYYTDKLRLLFQFSSRCMLLTSPFCSTSAATTTEGEEEGAEVRAWTLENPLECLEWLRMHVVPILQGVEKMLQQQEEEAEQEEEGGGVRIFPISVSSGGSHTTSSAIKRRKRGGGGDGGGMAGAALLPALALAQMPFPALHKPPLLLPHSSSSSTASPPTSVCCTFEDDPASYALESTTSMNHNSNSGGLKLPDVELQWEEEDEAEEEEAAATSAAATTSKRRRKPPPLLPSRLVHAEDKITEASKQLKKLEMRASRNRHWITGLRGCLYNVFWEAETRQPLVSLLLEMQESCQMLHVEYRGLKDQCAGTTHGEGGMRQGPAAATRSRQEGQGRRTDASSSSTAAAVDEEEEEEEDDEAGEEEEEQQQKAVEEEEGEEEEGQGDDTEMVPPLLQQKPSPSSAQQQKGKTTTTGINNNNDNKKKASNGKNQKKKHGGGEKVSKRENAETASYVPQTPSSAQTHGGLSPSLTTALRASNKKAGKTASGVRGKSNNTNTNTNTHNHHNRERRGGGGTADVKKKATAVSAAAVASALLSPLSTVLRGVQGLRSQEIVRIMLTLSIGVWMLALIIIGFGVL